ncbi:General transcription factor IIF subunit 2 [Binucleata daphniae]
MFIDASNSDVTTWLVKFPSYLSERIIELQTDTNIGTIEFKNGEASLLLGTSLISLPNQYKIKSLDIAKNMYVLKSDNKSCIIEGRVNKECNIVPIINKEYIEFKKATLQSVQKRALIVNRSDINSENVRNDVDALHKKRKKLLMEKKRERLDKEEVMDIIFRAYETKDAWITKELADFCGQPIAYIQEILPEICTLNKKDQKNTWNLKEEYKNQKKY